MVVDFGDKGGTWDADAGVMEFKRPGEGATCVGAAVDEEDVVFIEPEEGVVDALFFGSDGAAALKHCSKMFISMNAEAKNPGVFNEEDCCWDEVAALIFDASQELYFAFFLTIKCPLLLFLTEILARIQTLEADSEHFLNCQFGYLAAESCRYL